MELRKYIHYRICFGGVVYSSNGKIYFMNKKEKFKRLLLDDCKINVDKYLKLTTQEILNNTSKFSIQQLGFEQIHWYKVIQDFSESAFDIFVGTHPYLEGRPLKFSFEIKSEKDFNSVKNTIKKIYNIFEEKETEEIINLKFDSMKLHYINKGFQTETYDYGAGIHLIINQFELGY